MPRAVIRAVKKHDDEDRQILDLRSANACIIDRGTNWATRRMTLGLLLCDIILKPGRALIGGREDVSKYYHAWCSSEARASHQIVGRPYPGYLFKGWRCFHPDFCNIIVDVGFKGLPQGHCQAPDWAHEAQEGLSVKSGVALKRDVISFAWPMPRGPSYVGLCQDDHFKLLDVPIDLDVSLTDQAVRQDNVLWSKYVETCTCAGLKMNIKKRERNSWEISCVGAELLGRDGWVAAPHQKRAWFAVIVFQVAGLNWLPRVLLQQLVGLAISFALFRREARSCLSLVFAHTQGPADEWIFMSRMVAQELVNLALLVSILGTNLRAQVSQCMTATDASLRKAAVVRTRVPASVAEEVWRHRLRRGFHTSLERPSAKSFETLADLGLVDFPGVSDDADEDESLCMKGLESEWRNDLADGLSWQPVVSYTFAHQQHINILEGAALLTAAKNLAKRERSARVIIGSDSRVMLGALAKGRSASHAINRILRRMVPIWIGSNLYPGGIHFPTRLNRADDPTRSRTIRHPNRPFPYWMWLSEQSLLGLMRWTMRCSPYGLLLEAFRGFGIYIQLDPWIPWRRTSCREPYCIRRWCSLGYTSTSAWCSRNTSPMESLGSIQEMVEG